MKTFLRPLYGFGIEGWSFFFIHPDFTCQRREFFPVSFFVGQDTIIKVATEILLAKEGCLDVIGNGHAVESVGERLFENRIDQAEAFQAVFAADSAGYP